RTLSPEMREFAVERIRTIINQTAAAYDCTASISFAPNGYPVTENHPDAVERFRTFAAGTVGASSNEVGEWPTPVMGGEDFSFYCREVPSCFFFLGQQPEGTADPYPMVHTPIFNFNDDTMALGIELFCRIALEMTD
ncbi:MAG: M20/M25/M40 family metallo-hydrolase, partial [Planctomycetota bacterium]